MLSAAISQLQRRGSSQASVARGLGYSSVALSHLATGRAQVPVERAGEIAKAVGLNEAAFTLAVLTQRFPSLDIEAMVAEARDPITREMPPRSLIYELEALANKRLEELPEAKMKILREVVRDPSPQDRWVELDHLWTLIFTRDLSQRLKRSLTRADLDLVAAVLDTGNDADG
jgi:transcriptional regulator with XRE-family HTH domain